MSRIRREGEYVTPEEKARLRAEGETAVRAFRESGQKPPPGELFHTKVVTRNPDGTESHADCGPGE